MFAMCCYQCSVFNKYDGIKVSKPILSALYSVYSLRLE